MNTHTHIFAFYCLLITANSILAKGADNATPNPDRSEIHAGKETRILLHLLEMDEHRLARLRQTIERIETMSAKEKKQLHAKISSIHQMPPEKISAIRRKFKNIPRDKREAIHDQWIKMAPEEREELRSKLRHMTREERRKFLQDKGLLLPPPPKQHEITSQESSSLKSTTDPLN